MSRKARETVDRGSNCSWKCRLRSTPHARAACFTLDKPFIGFYPLIFLIAKQWRFRRDSTPLPDVRLMLDQPLNDTSGIFFGASGFSRV